MPITIGYIWIELKEVYTLNNTRADRHPSDLQQFMGDPLLKASLRLLTQIGRTVSNTPHVYRLKVLRLKSSILPFLGRI